MPKRPVVGVVFDPLDSNPAYYILIAKLDELGINVLQFDSDAQMNKTLID